MADRFSILEQKLSQVELLIMDVDGTLTDGGVYYTESGILFKKFNVYDGMGITLLHQNNIKTMFLSSDKTSIPQSRGEKLNVTYIYYGVARKLATINEFISETNIQPHNMAFVGDDINDLEIIELVGFSACPQNAHKLVKDKVDFVSDFSGGNGAVRQICEMILTAKGLPITLVYK